MIDDLQAHREDATKNQNDITEWKNRALTANLDKPHDSSKKSPGISRQSVPIPGLF